MTRLALIAGTYQPNRCGVAHYTSHLRKLLAKAGIASVILTTYEAAHVADKPNVVGSVRNWQLADLLPLTQAIHVSRADILHIQHAAGTYGFNRAIFLLPLLLRLTGWRFPIITTIHEYGWWEWQPAWIPPRFLEWLKTWGQQRHWWDREDGFLLSCSNVIITTNASTKQTICDRLPNLKPRIHQIPIGANITVFPSQRDHARQMVRQQYGWSADTLIVAFFGFLHPVKGLETLLPAFKQVLICHPQARLLLIGGVESLALRDQQASHYWDTLETRIAELDLGNTVAMTGYLDENTASQYLTGADIGVLPFNHGVTLKSGSLLALMAHALPVIATRSTPADPALSDRLVRLVTPRNRDELAAELSTLLNNSDLRNQLAAAGSRFSQTFDWATITQAHLQIYQSCAQHRAIAPEPTV